jgi:hypothetical protein
MAKRKAKAASGEPRRVVNMIRPRHIDSVVEFAKAWYGGETPRLNQGVFSGPEWDKFRADQKAAKDAGKVFPTPNIYQPVIIGYANELDCVIGFAGSAEKRPAEWNDNILGTFDGTATIGAMRLNHVPDVTKLIVDPESNVVKIGRLGTFLVGLTDLSAIHLVHFSKTGSFGAISRVGKELAAQGVKGLDTLVARINDKVIKETLEDGSEIVWGPGMRLEWGRFTKGENSRPMTPHAVRNLAADGADLDGVKFTALSEPIRLNNVDPKELVRGVKKLMQAADTKDEDGNTDWDRFLGRKARSGEDTRAAEDRLWGNVGTCCRLSPKVLRCHGFKSVQIGLPIFTCFEGETAEDAKLRVGFGVGARLPIAWSENTWAMRGRLTPPTKKVKARPAKKEGAAKEGTAKKSRKGKARSHTVTLEVTDTSEEQPTTQSEVVATQSEVVATPEPAGTTA